MVNTKASSINNLAYNKYVRFIMNPTWYVMGIGLHFHQYKITRLAPKVTIVYRIQTFVGTKT